MERYKDDMLEDAKQPMSMIPECKIEVIGKNANKMVDWVANQTRKGMSYSRWSKCLPFFLVCILDKDGLPAPHR